MELYTGFLSEPPPVDRQNRFEGECEIDSKFVANI